MNDMTMTGPYNPTNKNEYYMVVIENKTFTKMNNRMMEYIQWFINEHNYTKEEVQQQIMSKIQMTLDITLKIYTKEMATQFKLRWM